MSDARWSEDASLAPDDWFERLHGDSPRWRAVAMSAGEGPPSDPRAAWEWTRARLQRVLREPPVPAASFASTSLIRRILANWSDRIVHELRPNAAWADELGRLRARCRAFLAERPLAPDSPSERSAWIHELETLLRGLADALESASDTAADLMLDSTARVIDSAPSPDLEAQAEGLGQVLDWLAETTRPSRPTETE